MDEEKEEHKLEKEKLMQPPWEPVWRFLKMLKKNWFTIWSSYIIPGHILKDANILPETLHFSTHVHCCCLHNSQEMEAAQTPINYCVDNENVVHIQNGMLLRCKEK